MLSYLAKRAIGAFERRWQYDGSYMHELVNEAGPGSLLPLNALAKVAKYRRSVPIAAYHAAKITGSLAADCGPCTQLAVSMAAAQRVSEATLCALVAGEPAGLGRDERLGYDFARAVIARDGADEVRRAVLARWGRRGLVSLAYALVSAQAYPTLKYALGHGRACTAVRIQGIEVPRGTMLRG